MRWLLLGLFALLGCGGSITYLNNCNVLSLPVSIEHPYGASMVQCGVTSSVINNGADAPVVQFDVIEYIDPCGPQGSYDEVLLRLHNGTVLALFTSNMNGDYPRLALIPDGTFTTSDGTSCTFTLSSANGMRTITWTGYTSSWNL